MDMADRKEYEGPRVPREQEWDAVQELIRAVFHPKVESFEEAMRTWPMALRLDVREDTLVMFRDGRPVSAIERLERDMLVYGHRLRMGFIGGVCTDPDHRGKGLASTILAATMTRFHEDDVDFVYISGARGLYFRIGADRASIKTRFVLRREISAGMTWTYSCAPRRRRTSTVSERSPNGRAYASSARA